MAGPIAGSPALSLQPQEQAGASQRRYSKPKLRINSFAPLQECSWILQRQEYLDGDSSSAAAAPEGTPYCWQ